MSSLKHELFKNPNRCLFLEERASCLEFQPDERRAHGFSISQLIHYTLEPHTASAPDGPPQRLTLGFSTADVVVTGWRLDALTEELRSHKGGVIKKLPDAARYEQLESHACAVAQIEINPLGKA